mmetsp:Transcript_16476/g.28287  ORF Transcript_16476/g.28287 Transcript_16476/m.28287 type:complete len:266 (-) Transcript_16476:187-984(-)
MVVVIVMRFSVERVVTDFANRRPQTEHTVFAALRDKTILMHVQHKRDDAEQIQRVRIDVLNADARFDKRGKRCHINQIKHVAQRDRETLATRSHKDFARVRTARNVNVIDGRLFDVLVIRGVRGRVLCERGRSGSVRVERERLVTGIFERFVELGRASAADAVREPWAFVDVARVIVAVLHTNMIVLLQIQLFQRRINFSKVIERNKHLTPIDVDSLTFVVVRQTRSGNKLKSDIFNSITIIINMKLINKVSVKRIVIRASLRLL